MTSDGKLLERRAHRLVWNLGYFARRRIKIQNDEREDITDIDVIGIKFDNFASSSLIVMETKHERGFNSILKLKGFLEYYKSVTGYLIRSNLSPSITDFSNQLNIRAMSIIRLEELEKELGIMDTWKLSYSETYDAIVLRFSKLLERNGFNQQLNLQNQFWNGDEPFYRLKNLIATLTKLHEEIKHGKEVNVLKSIEWLIMELTTLCSVSILEVISLLFLLPEHQKKSFFINKLVAGKLSLSEKEKLLDVFYSLLVTYARENKLPITTNRNEMNLSPPYSGELFLLTSRFMTNLPASNEIPRILDIYLFYQILDRPLTKEIILGELKIDEEKFQFSLKFTRDLVQFLFLDKINVFKNLEKLN